jgi:hypothetical protein
MCAVDVTSEYTASLGVARVVKKPFEAERLVDLIRTVLLEHN